MVVPAAHGRTGRTGDASLGSVAVTNVHSIAIAPEHARAVGPSRNTEVTGSERETTRQEKRGKMSALDEDDALVREHEKQPSTRRSEPGSLARKTA